MKRKQNMETISVKVDADLYQTVKECLREISVSPEYATTQFMTNCANLETQIMCGFINGKSAEALIAEAADKTLLSLMAATVEQRRTLRRMEMKEREISTTELRRNWTKELSFLEESGHVLIITRRGKRSAAMMSAQTDLIITSMSADDKTIRERCDLMQLM